MQMSREKSKEKGTDQDAKSTKSTTPNDNDKHAYIFREDCGLLAGAIQERGSPLSR